MTDHSGFKAQGEIDLNQNIIKNRGGICIVDRSTTLAVANATSTLVEFNREIYDPQDWHSTTNYPSRITIPEAGIYKVQAHARYYDNATGDRAITLYKNGLVYIPAGSYSVGAWQPQASGSRRTLTFFYVLTLSQGHYLEIKTWQNSGETLTLQHIIFYVERI